LVLATSGTIGATVIDVAKIIEHAFRRAGVTTSKITGEQQLAAAENLYLLLTDLSNDGVNLWCIVKQLLALTVGQATYSLPVGVVDVLRAFSRTMFYPSGVPIVTTATVGLDAGAGAAPATCTVGVAVSTSVAAQNLVVEYSQDAAAWVTTYVIPTFTGVAGQVYWFDLPIVIGARAWRVRETIAASIGVSAAQFGNTPEDILMAKLTRDQYWMLPNKAVLGRELQYWYDKQVTPQIWVWQVPNDATRLVVVEEHMQIQDVGALTNTLAIPQRWLNYAIWELSSYCSNERPKEERDPERIAYCEKRALSAKVKAETGESDGAPLQLAPNIRCYTR
jgi:hypothetical protein